MKIRCWGARGSIPVSGEQYVRYGGDTACLEIRNASDDIIIVDCGSGIRRLGNSLLREKRSEYTLIFTHAHWDHILGFPFFKPLYFSSTRIAVHGCVYGQRSIRSILSETMEPPFFPVDLSAIKAQITFSDTCNVPLHIGGMQVIPIELSHPNRGFGYKFIEGGASFVFLTDNELDHQHPGGRSFDDYAEFCRGADLLIHDAEYTDEDYRRTRAWGHSRCRRAVELGLAAGVRSLGLYHHNQDRSDEGIDVMVEDCREIIRQSGSRMECFAVTQETVLELP